MLFRSLLPFAYHICQIYNTYHTYYIHHLSNRLAFILATSLKMAPSIPNADISNNTTKISNSSTLPPATPPNYESTHKNRRRVSSVEGIKHIWLITGPAGCGKTTVAKAVSEKLGLRYLEGDDVSLFCYLPPPSVL